MLPARDMPLRTGDPDAAPERLHAWDSQAVLKREFSALEAAFDPRRSRGGREQPLTLRVAPPGQPTDLQAVDNDIPQNEVPTGAVGAGSIKLSLLISPPTNVISPCDARCFLMLSSDSFEPAVSRYLY